MRLHTDMTSDQMTRAVNAHIRLRGTRGLGRDRFEDHVSRKRAHAYELHLAAWQPITAADDVPDLHHDRSGRRHANSGVAFETDMPYAASYDEWGLFLAELFELDPRMIAGTYDGRDDFHAKTGHAYTASVTA
jgi:hypothetical protein